MIETLGEPRSYVLGTAVVDANNLPHRLAMIYPAGVHVIISGEEIQRITLLEPGVLLPAWISHKLRSEAS